MHLKNTFPETSGNQPTSLVVRDALISRGARAAFLSILSLPNRNFGADFDGGDGGDGDRDNSKGRDGDASDEGEGGKNRSGAWRKQQWQQKMQGAVDR